MCPHPRDMDMTGLSPVTKTTQTRRRTTARPAWCQARPGHERRASLAASPGCWRAWPMGACVTLILTQECSRWRSRSALATSRRQPRTMTTNQTCCAPDPPDMRGTICT
jgi:hypothetical protein